MAAAVMQLTLYTGSTGATTFQIDQTIATPVALLFNTADDNSTTTNPIIVPTTTGTAFSFPKAVALKINTSGTTNITSIGWQLAQTLTTGFFLYFKSLGASYVQSTAAPASTATAGATPPATYTLMNATVQNTQSGVALATSGAAGTVVGNYVALLFGVDNTYAAAGGTGVGLVASGNAFSCVYDEQ